MFKVINKLVSIVYVLILCISIAFHEAFYYFQMRVGGILFGGIAFIPNMLYFSLSTLVLFIILESARRYFTFKTGVDRNATPISYGDLKSGLAFPVMIVLYYISQVVLFYMNYDLIQKDWIPINNYVGYIIDIVSLFAVAASVVEIVVKAITYIKNVH